MSFPPRTDLRPWLTARKPINIPVLSPTLLQIYCIGFIGPISYSFWVWAAIFYPTIVDQAISSIESRFEQFQIYEDIFCFLFNFEKLKALDDNRLKKYCLNLKNFSQTWCLLWYWWLRFIFKTNSFKRSYANRWNTPINVLNYLKRLDSFPNVYIAYRILLAITVTVASAERSFSKFKLIKSYLRSTMSQEKLSGLAVLSIEKEMLKALKYKNLISNFASQKVRKIDFK